MAVERLAQLYSSRLQYTQALLTYQQAVAIYNTALHLAGNDSCNHALKAGALESMADLQLNLSEYTQAIENYQQAIAHHQTSLGLNPMKVNAFVLGQTLAKLANCQEQLLQKGEALKNYHAALSLFHSALPPGDKHIRYLNQKIQKLVSS